MDQQKLMEYATLVSKLKMYPYFDVANYILMCSIVREDNHPQPGSGSNSTLFSRKHPLACWISSMVLCFAGSILGNFLVGEPVITPFKNHRDLLTATAVWYCINYSPFDIIYRLTTFSPVSWLIKCAKEVQRVHKIHHGVAYAFKAYPGAYVVIVILGVVKGTGSSLMRPVARFTAGIWKPHDKTEWLSPSFMTKSSMVASIIFLLERLNMIPQLPHPTLYFTVVLFFIYFRLSALIMDINDPFAPFENLFCAIFMGGIWDALKKATTRTPKKEDGKQYTKPEKAKEDKKND